MDVSKIQIALKSPVFWGIVGLFVYNGLSAILPQLQGTPAEIVNGVILLLGMFLHPSEVQQAGKTQ